MRLSRIALFLLAVASLTLSLMPGSQPASALPETLEPLSKVAPWVLDNTRNGARASVLVVMAEQADTSDARLLRTKEEKGRYVYETLTRVAEQSQRPLRSQLETLGVPFRSFWIVNAINLEADLALVTSLAQRSDVARIEGNPWVSVDLPTPEQRQASTNIVEAVAEWGVENINAPAAWDKGVDGSGIVVGGEDTGYRWTHNELKSKYRGWDGAEADHNYNWWDAIDLPGPVCPARSDVPCDDHGHGTHTMGTMVGGDGPGAAPMDIGIAFGAQWIGCRNMVQGLGAPVTYIECHEFMLAPTDLNGENPRPELAPHVINNSWGCLEACPHDVVHPSVKALVDAGIVYVASAGNDGPACETIAFAPAMFEESFAVAAHDDTNTLADFSSRGPVASDASFRRKPDVSAPGVSVRSAWGGADDEYDSASGTSMAGPHVAGAVALLLDAKPDLIGNPAAVRAALEGTAVADVKLPEGDPFEECGGIHYTEVPNNHFGYGRIDVNSAVGEPGYSMFVPVLFR